MASRKEPVYVGMDHAALPETDCAGAFESLLQFALLMALKEFGLIHDLEFQQADKLLKQNGRSE